MAPLSLRAQSPLSRSRGTPILVRGGGGAPPPPVRRPSHCIRDSAVPAEHAALLPEGRKSGADAKSSARGHQQLLPFSKPTFSSIARSESRLRQRSLSCDIAELRLPGDSCPSTPLQSTRASSCGPRRQPLDHPPESGAEASDAVMEDMFEACSRRVCGVFRASDAAIDGVFKAVQTSAGKQCKHESRSACRSTSPAQSFSSRRRAQPSHGAVVALAEEYLSVCGSYEAHLHELKTMCRAINRSSSASALPRQVGTGTSPRRCASAAGRPSPAAAVAPQPGFLPSGCYEGSSSASALPRQVGTGTTPRRRCSSPAGTPSSAAALAPQPGFLPSGCDEGSSSASAVPKQMSVAATPTRCRSPAGRSSSAAAAVVLKQKEAATVPTRSGTSAGRSRSIACPQQAPTSLRKATCVRTGSADRCNSPGGRFQVPRILPPRQRQPSPGANLTGTAVNKLVASLLAKGLLSSMAQAWNDELVCVANDLEHVRTVFAAQVPSASVSRVFRVENAGPAGVYEAVRKSLDVQQERVLWHGTSADSVHNIISSGFNRAYCGRHGTKLGHGTYFSSSPDYSVRFCGRKASCRLMLLAKVLIGEWTKGNPELIEPPYRDAEKMKRYDSTVDDVELPGIFCIFRDFQALPLYLVEFTGKAL